VRLLSIRTRMRAFWIPAANCGMRSSVVWWQYMSASCALYDPENLLGFGDDWLLYAPESLSKWTCSSCDVGPIRGGMASWEGLVKNCTQWEAA